MSSLTLNYPLQSLRAGRWFKLICGASFQHLPAVRNLTLAYALAGADCIDVAADPAVIASAREALEVARQLSSQARSRGFGGAFPWLMVSLNDGEDPHFRKAEFDPAACPPDCPRPCEAVCPADAIAFDRAGDGFSGVIDRRCYGCGRCLPVCPISHISTRSYVSSPGAIASEIFESDIDAIEIHTRVGRLDDFRRLWQAIAPYADRLKLLAVSCPDDPALIDYLNAIYEAIAPLPCPLIWQTDGRPMSGDIGRGTTHSTLKLGQKVLAAGLPGYVQLAGGTNDHTVAKLKRDRLLAPAADRPFDQNAQIEIMKHRDAIDKRQPLISSDATFPYIAGIAYGSYARTLLSPILDRLDRGDRPTATPRLEEDMPLLWSAVSLAHALVAQLKPNGG